VVDGNGLRGMVRFEQIEAAMAANHQNEPLGSLVREPDSTEHLTAENFPHVHPDHPLDIALRRLAENRLQILPVVSRTNVRELKGTISVDDIMQSYALGRPAAQSADRSAAPIGASPRRLLIGVTASLVGLGLLLGFLNYFYRAERASRGQRYFAAANQLIEAHRYEEAIEQYRNALSVSHSIDYRLALALALVKAGHLDEARIYLGEVLGERPADGPANLGLAEIEAQQNNIDQAVLYYHRAIDGIWPSQAAQSRFQARLELVQALGKAGRSRQARAELLSAASAGPRAGGPSDNESKKQVGRMLVQYGLPRDAAALFRDVVQHDKRDTGAWDGLGDAAFAEADYARAREAYRSSLTIDPTDQHARQRLDLTEKIVALDPTLPGLTAAQRLRRSRDLLTAAAAVVNRCGADPGTLPRRAATAENLARAAQVWNARPGACQLTADEQPLALVMAEVEHR
jgi:tetratricopeptide (TPR) repeat protein